MSWTAQSWWDALEPSERDSVVVLRWGQAASLRRSSGLDFTELGPYGQYYCRRLFATHMVPDGSVRP